MPMSNTVELYRKFKPDHTKFSGVIYEHDFGMHISMTDEAQRASTIAHFNETCQRNSEGRERKNALERSRLREFARQNLEKISEVI